MPEGVDSGVGLEVTNSDSTDTHVTIQVSPVVHPWGRGWSLWHGTV